MNDSLRTGVFVRFHPETIACACIYLAARTLEVGRDLCSESDLYPCFSNGATAYIEVKGGGGRNEQF